MKLQLNPHKSHNHQKQHSLCKLVSGRLGDTSYKNIIFTWSDTTRRFSPRFFWIGHQLPGGQQHQKRSVKGEQMHLPQLPNARPGSFGVSFGYGNLTFLGDPPTSSVGVGGAFPMKEPLVLRILICSNIVYWSNYIATSHDQKGPKWLAKSQGNGTPAYYQGNFCEGEILFHLARNSWSIPESWFSHWRCLF